MVSLYVDPNGIHTRSSVTAGASVAAGSAVFAGWVAAVCAGWVTVVCAGDDVFGWQYLAAQTWRHALAQ